MKNLLLVILFIPFLSSGQNFEISEMGGFSTELSCARSSGFADRVSLNYNFLKHFSLGAFCEMNMSTPSAYSPSTYSVGITPEFRTRHFYIGADIAYLGVSKYNNLAAQSLEHNYYLTYPSAFLFGLHCGLKQNLSKHLSVREQLGMNTSTFNPNFYTFELYPAPYSNTQSYFYVNALAGLAYWF